VATSPADVAVGVNLAMNERGDRPETAIRDQQRVEEEENRQDRISLFSLDARVLEAESASTVREFCPQLEHGVATRLGEVVLGH